MPEMGIRFTSAALGHVEKIADYHLERVGAKSAEKITDKLLNAFEVLKEHPYAGPVHPDPVLQKYGYRKLVCGEYIGVYKIEDDAIIVYGIFHGSTNYPALFE